MTINEYHAFRRRKMSKYTDFRDRIDRQEARVDSWLDKLKSHERTARIGCATVIFLTAMGLLLWVW